MNHIQKMLLSFGTGHAKVKCHISLLHMKVLKRKFIDNPNFKYEGTFIGVEDGKVIGFVNSVYKKDFLPRETFENTPGYITFVIVDSSMRRRGYGTELLKKAEEHLKSTGKSIIAINFFNPINLEWFIPGSNKYDHPNATGVDTSGHGCEFLIKNGYIERTREVSMYLNLSEFVFNDNALSIKKELEHKGIRVEYYDKNGHHGFDDLFTDLNHELWMKALKHTGLLQTANPSNTLNTMMH